MPVPDIDERSASPGLKTLKILFVEDSLNDYELIQLKLRQGGYDFTGTRVENAADFSQALASGDWNLVLSDYALPGFDGLKAFEIYRESGLDIPFIIISGTIGEELAVDAMKRGVHDYLMKDKLGRLVPAIERELKETAQRQARRQAESQIRESEERFRTMADSAPTLIWMADAEGRTVYVNQGWCDFLGLTEEECVDEGITNAILAEDLPEVLRQYEDAFSRRGPYSIECRLRRKDGQVRWLIHQGAPRFLSNGDFAGYIGSSLDITERKQAEQDLKAYAEKLELSNRELEQFAMIASHDLQEPLRKVKLYSEMIATTATPDTREAVDRMQQSVTRMQDLITDLLALSRVNRKGEPFTRVSLDAALKNALNDLELSIQDSKAEIKAGPLGEIDADFRQMEQLFQNLIGNALKFRRDDIPPVITINGETVGDCYRITVTDNGIGFDESYSERIFNPFERLHATDKYGGTGIGLSICRKIAERHQGSIRAISTPGAGAVFIIELPLQQQETAVPS